MGARISSGGVLLEPSFLHSADRFERLHPRGHLRRIYPLAERLPGTADGTTALLRST